MPEKPYTRRRSFLADFVDWAIVRHFRRVNQTTEWHLLPTWKALLNLVAFRSELREHNLYDTETKIQIRPKLASLALFE